jgi:hypothetical protein
VVTSPNSDKYAILSRVLSWPSYQLFLVCVLIGGALLCAGSFALHIYDLQSPIGPPFSCDLGKTCGQRQIGYLWAPNWSLTYAILGPAALFLMVEALKGIRDALDYLYETEMVRDELMKPVSSHASSDEWQSGTRIRSWLLFACAGLVPAVLGYREWYAHNLMRLMKGSCPECGPSDYDWGLAAIFRGVPGVPNWALNSIFDFLAFSCETFLIGSAVLCFLYLLDLDQVLPGPETRVKKHLLPNLRSDDPRRGFQKFEEPLQLMLNACLTFFIICYGIRINRLYMRSASASIVDFVQNDIHGLVASKVVELKGSELLGVLFSAPSDPQYQEFLGGIALMLVSLFSLGVISLTVGKAARHAKANAEEYYEGPGSAALFGLTLEEEKERTKKMTTWPLEWRYFQLDSLLGIMGVALVSLYYYRIGFYIVLLVIVTLLARFKKAVGS